MNCCPVCSPDHPNGSCVCPPKEELFHYEHGHQWMKEEPGRCRLCNLLLGVSAQGYPLCKAVYNGGRGPLYEEIAAECDAIKMMLQGKNSSYGNSALDPVRIFSKASPVEQILVRLDDKLSRLARGSAAGEDVELDLIGYLILLRIARKASAPSTQTTSSEAPTP